MAAYLENTLIGLCDEAIERKKTISTFLTSKIGGEPDKIPAVCFRYPSCTVCKSALTHVVQVYCPLDASPYHRTINVFACTNTDCQGKSDGWKVLRSQCLDSDVKLSTGAAGAQQAPHVQPAAPMASTDWCADADDWGVEEEDCCSSTWTTSQTPTVQPSSMAVTESAAADVGSQFQSLSISTTEEDCQPAGPTFQEYYISVVEEGDFTADSGMEHAQDLLREYEEREGASVMELGDSGGGGGGGEEKYEKTEARHGDAVFSGFMKKVSLCPEQILRYCRNGSPLLISKPPLDLEKSVPKCSHCGSGRTFEFQLMPALVSLLCSNNASETELAVEFGTVMVYTCQSSCWKSGLSSPVEECAVVQQDPDQKFFK
ncbi:programmed cell death protein 2-like [Engraulis encrasicolus]|uniref:programmed cell death protein 2-like n=1 Tax=Engraulis encrasicolus TaxID=184585 RepID=UPI002FCE7494